MVALKGKILPRTAENTPFLVTMSVPMLFGPFDVAAGLRVVDAEGDSVNAVGNGRTVLFGEAALKVHGVGRGGDGLGVGGSEREKQGKGGQSENAFHGEFLFFPVGERDGQTVEMDYAGWFGGGGGDSCMGAKLFLRLELRLLQLCDLLLKVFVVFFQCFQPCQYLRDFVLRRGRDGR